MKDKTYNCLQGTHNSCHQVDIFWFHIYHKYLLENFLVVLSQIVTFHYEHHNQRPTKQLFDESWILILVHLQGLNVCDNRKLLQTYSRIVLHFRFSLFIALCFLCTWCHIFFPVYRFNRRIMPFPIFWSNPSIRSIEITIPSIGHGPIKEIFIFFKREPFI